MAEEPIGALLELSVLLKQVIVEAGTDITKLGRAIHYPRQQISRAVNGREVPSAGLTKALTLALGHTEVIMGLRGQADLEHRARRNGVALRPSGDDRTLQPAAQPATLSAPLAGGTIVEEVSSADANRRQTFHAAGLLALGSLVDDISQRIADADLDEEHIDEAEATIRGHAADYLTTPHGAKLAVLVPQWSATEAALERRVKPAVRARLTLVAGWQAFYLGLLAFDLGHDQGARKSLRLAKRHAGEVEELLPARSSRHGDVLLLRGSVAAIQSTVAYFAGSYGDAADIAAQARENAHPYTRPILAGCQARAAAIARPADVEAVLADMQDHVWDGPILPGPNPGNSAFVHGFMAVSLNHLNQGQRAERYAQTGLELEKSFGPDHYVQIAGTHNALALSHLRRPDPDRDAAVASVQNALMVVDGRPTRGVIQRAGEMWRQMDTQWPGVSSVQQLGEQVRHSRLALEAGQPVEKSV